MNYTTLEQKRAQHAWDCSDGCDKEYANCVKSLPALIMNSGLMQVLAFLHQKGGRHEIINQRLRQWLKQRYPKTIDSDQFEFFMQALIKADPRTYQDITIETLSWLKWLRQMANARQGGI